MATSAKAQEEKNSKAIRELMKLPANKTCFDCGQKGPVYANLSIGTFVCTTCSGVHRELSHRVKSVSMSTFTNAEVEKMTSIGNEAASQEWHATWNPTENPQPDGNDAAYLRKFIFLTYQNKAFIAKSSKSKDSSTSSPGSGKTSSKKNVVSTGSTKITRNKSNEPAVPTPEPLSNILGPNIPSIDVGSGYSNSNNGNYSINNGNNSNKSSSKIQSQQTSKPNDSPLLIDLLGDSSSNNQSNSSSKKPAHTSSANLLDDLASLSFSAPPSNPQNASYSGFNPFGGGPPAPNNSSGFGGFTQQPSQPAVDPQQLQQLQNQVKNMQLALASAQQQMTSVQQQIVVGNQNFAQLNDSQKTYLNSLIQKELAMSQQYAAMDQQFQEASNRLKTMMAAAQNQNNNTAFSAFGPSSTTSAFNMTPMSPSSNNSTGFGAPSTPTSNSSNLFGPSATNTYSTPSNNAYSSPSTMGYTNGSSSMYSSNSGFGGSHGTIPTYNTSPTSGIGATYASQPAKSDWDPWKA